MKIIATYLLTLVIFFGAFELYSLGFKLMNQSDSLLFYTGLTLIMLLSFAVGWFVIKELSKMFDNCKSEKKDNNIK